MQDIKIAMIGGGFMGKAHSLAYSAMPMFFWPAPARPVKHVVVDATEDLARTAADRYGWNTSSSSWEAVINDPEVDLVDIATPNNLHAEIAIAAAEAGKHVICEKPLAPTSAEALQMLEAVERAGVVSAVAFNSWMWNLKLRRLNAALLLQLCWRVTSSKLLCPGPL